MSTITSEKNVYAAQFSEMVGGLPGQGLAWMDRLRRTGMDRFLEQGFPTTRLEQWKYTNVTPISRLTFRPTSGRSSSSTPDFARQFDWAPSPRLVFVDGILDRELSINSPL